MLKLFRILTLLPLLFLACPIHAQKDTAEQIYQVLQLDVEMNKAYDFFQKLTGLESFNKIERKQLMEGYRTRFSDLINSHFSQSELEEILDHIQRHPNPPRNYSDWYNSQYNALVFGHSSDPNETTIMFRTPGNPDQ